MAVNTPAKQLFDLLVTKNYDPDLLNSAGMPSTDPSETEVFSFDWTAESGKDYGTVVIMLGDDSNLDVYFGDNLGRTMEAEDKQEWFNFLEQLKNFATRNMLSFGTKNLNRLRYSMQSQAAVKESIFESWTGTKTTSWNGRPTEARLMIRHKRPLGETDARFRYVESLFIETAEGERYKLPFTKLSGGRAMVEHVRNGGKPYDARGLHIAEMVTELNVLSRFRRANHGKIFEGDTAQLVEETNAYYESLNRTLKSLSGHRGYTAYFESWNPEVITEEEAVVEGLKHLFVTQSLDQRVEDALPLLAKIQQQGQAMKEANIFEAWAEKLTEGTWAIPDTAEKKAKLVALMSKPLTVGPDATNATEQLYDLLGDDELFDQLEALSTRDPDADCRQVVYDRMQLLSSDPDINDVINDIQLDDTAEMNPAPQVDPADTEPKDDLDEFFVELKDPATQTEDPAGTPQPDYEQYDDTLSKILKIAGVPGQERPAPDYEVGPLGVAEDSIEDVDCIGGDSSDEFMSDVMTNQKKDELAEEGEEQLDEFAPLAAAIGGALGRAAVGATASTIEKGLASMAGSALASKLADNDEEDYVDEARCNMSEAGEECPVHGMEECWGAHTPAVPVAEESDPMLSRIKTLAGMLVK